MEDSRMSVGHELVQVLDDRSGVLFPLLIFYPSSTPATPERLGPFPIELAIRGEIAGGPHPLVLISHGSGGSPATHRELACHLARRGFVVGVPEHPFNSRTDNSRAESVELLADRPHHLRLVADWFAQSHLAPHVDTDRYAIVGHSIGGYTALAAAGGAPSCLPHEVPERRARPIQVTPDARVRAVVLLAPATPWFRLPGALSAVRVPILAVASYHDQQAPYFYMCQLVLDGVPDPSQVDYRLVERAGHYSFLSPWPEALKSAAILPSQDPPGFDRPAFLAALYVDVSSFLERHCKGGRAGAQRK
jgi:predicted dienelactone hydrolase